MNQSKKKTPWIKRLGKDIVRYADAYILVLPVVLFYLIFAAAFYNGGI